MCDTDSFEADFMLEPNAGKLRSWRSQLVHPNDDKVRQWHPADGFNGLGYGQLP